MLLSANQGTGPSLDLFGAVGFRTGIAASKIGLFEALETGPDQTPSNLAKQLGLDERAVRSLMALLESLGYLRSRSSSYQLTKMSRKWMLQTSQIPHIDFLRWWHDFTFPFLDEQILEVLERGRPAVSIHDWMDDQPDAWETAQKGFEAVARQLAPMASASVDLSGARRLLDTGGGDGLHAIELRRRYPNLEANDLRQTRGPRPQENIHLP